MPAGIPLLGNAGHVARRRKAPAALPPTRPVVPATPGGGEGPEGRGVAPSRHGEESTTLPRHAAGVGPALPAQPELLEIPAGLEPGSLEFIACRPAATGEFA